MEGSDNNEILCISCGDKVYGVEFEYLAEICSNMKVTRVPCLPADFLGVYNYRGLIIPVMELEDTPDAIKGEHCIPENMPDAAGTNHCIPEHSSMSVVKYGQYKFGILCREEPFILQAKELQRVDGPDDSRIFGIWQSKCAYKYSGGLCLIIDVPGSVENMLSIQL